MSTYFIYFILMPHIKIVVPLYNHISEIGYRNNSLISFLHNGKIIFIARNTVYWNIRCLRDQLYDCLTGRLGLYSSLILDIGYLYNKYYKNTNRFCITAADSYSEDWIGDQYELWDCLENEKAYVTWLYNDHDANIIFEITPSYPYFFCDIKKQRYFVPYKQWIKNYKPYFKIQLSRETAQQWYEQADHFVKTVDDNSARWKKECEEKTCETCSKMEQRKKIAKRNYDI